MGGKKKNSSIIIPVEAKRDRLVDTVVDAPEGVPRLVALMKACADYDGTILKFVSDLAEDRIKRLDIISWPKELNKITFKLAVSSWVNSINQKPLKTDKRDILLLLLQFGSYRRLIDYAGAIDIIDKSLKKSSKGKNKSSSIVQPEQKLLEALISSFPSVAVLTTHSLFFDALTDKKKRIQGQDEEIQGQKDENEKLKGEFDSLRSTIEDMKVENANQVKQKIAAENEVAELKTKNIDLRDGYKHKLDDLRGRIRGVLQGRFARVLQTALEASQSDPPWNEAIQERLEEALKLIEKEAEWLQLSD